jgi:hypothetical protein
MSMPFKWLPSVEAIRDNVVFFRLTRHSRWPSPRTTVWLFGVVFLVGTGGAAALLFVDPAFLTDIGELVGTVIVLGGLAVAFLSPPVAAVITVITTAADVQSEAYQLMRVSLLPREEIVLGYIYAALYRLRLLWVLAFGWSLLSIAVVIFLLGPPYQGDPVAVPVLVVMVALLVWFISMVIGAAVNWLAVCIAVWQSLCRKRVGIAIIAALAVLWVTGGVPACASCLAFAWVASASEAVVALICYPVSFFFLARTSVSGLTKMIRKKAEGCI